MKYYKLINDIPMFKKGDLFFIHPEEGCLLQKDTLRLAYHKKTLEKNPEILKNWFEEVEESENKRWRAKESKDYWFINDFGEIECDNEYGLDSNDNLYAMGNYFKAEKEAEAYREYLIARQALLDDAKGGKFIEGDKNWHAFYNIIDKTYVGMSDISYYLSGVIYFKDEESISKSLKDHKEQWKIVRKYEMGK